MNRNNNKTRTWLAALGLAALTLPAAAQEGHPLTGTWLGEWGPQGQGNFLTLILQWDGERIGGVVNPGPGAGAINAITLDSSTWTVGFDMNIAPEGGDAGQWLAQGELRDIGSYSRNISGTWTQGGESGRFTLVRQGR